MERSQRALDVLQDYLEYTATKQLYLVCYHADSQTTRGSIGFYRPNANSILLSGKLSVAFDVFVQDDAQAGWKTVVSTVPRFWRGVPTYDSLVEQYIRHDQQLLTWKHYHYGLTAELIDPCYNDIDSALTNLNDRPSTSRQGEQLAALKKLLNTMACERARLRQQLAEIINLRVLDDHMSYHGLQEVYLRSYEPDLKRVRKGVAILQRGKPILYGGEPYYTFDAFHKAVNGRSRSWTVVVSKTPDSWTRAPTYQQLKLAYKDRRKLMGQWRALQFPPNPTYDDIEPTLAKLPELKDSWKGKQLKSVLTQLQRPAKTSSAPATPTKTSSPTKRPADTSGDPPAKRAHPDNMLRLLPDNKNPAQFYQSYTDFFFEHTGRDRKDVASAVKLLEVLDPTKANNYHCLFWLYYTYCNPDYKPFIDYYITIMQADRSDINVVLQLYKIIHKGTLEWFKLRMLYHHCNIPNKATTDDVLEKCLPFIRYYFEQTRDSPTDQRAIAKLVHIFGVQPNDADYLHIVLKFGCFCYLNADKLKGAKP